MRVIKPKSTAIRVNGETWKVPRGFGREYKRIAKEIGPRWQSDTRGLCDLLRLVGYDAAHEAVQEWPLRRCVEASVYAANLHLRASDNAVLKHPKPYGWPNPWRGRDIANMAYNPVPTVLR